MPRSPKIRKICAEPRFTQFVPLHEQRDNTVVEMSYEEYETIHLIDARDYTQEKCAEQMGVSRSTVQAIYQVARKKIADCMVNGRTLAIAGGNYQVCEHKEVCCGSDNCKWDDGNPCPLDEQCNCKQRVLADEKTK